MPVAPGEIGRRQLPGRGRRELRQHVPLARTERSPREGVTGRQDVRGLASFAPEPDPSLEPWTRPGTDQRPLEAEAPVARQGAQSAQQAGATVGTGQVADGTRPPLELRQEVGIGRVDRRPRPAVRPRRELRDELEPLEEPGRQHRPQDERRRREVVAGDPAREPERQRREQRAIRADAIDDGLRGDGRQRDGFRDHDPEGLPPPELDEDRLADDEVGERLRDEVGVGPVTAPARRVDRHFDRAQPRAGGCPDRVLEDQGERE